MGRRLAQVAMEAWRVAAHEVTLELEGRREMAAAAAEVGTYRMEGTTRTPATRRRRGRWG